MKSVLVILVIFASGCRCQSRKESATRIPFKLNWSIYGEHAPFYVAQEKGYFLNEGLEIKIITGNGSGATVKTVAEGTIPLGYADSGTMIKQGASGHDVFSVAVFTQQSPMSFIYSKEHPIKSWKEIKGKKIGLTVSDASNALFRIILGKLGIKDSEVQLVTIATPHAREKALVQGKIDGFFGYYINEPHRMAKKYRKSFGWLKVTDLGINILSSAVIVNRQFAKTHPDHVTKFVRAAQKGLQYVRNNPEESATILAKQSDELDQETSLKMIEEFVKLNYAKQSNDKPLGWSDSSNWAQSIKFLTDHYSFKGDRKPEVYYSNKFLSDIK